MTKIKLPSSPLFIDTAEKLRARDIQVARFVLEAAAKVCEQPVDEIQITDTDSHLCYMDGIECAEEIRALEISHD